MVSKAPDRSREDQPITSTEKVRDRALEGTYSTAITLEICTITIGRIKEGARRTSI
jgi:hypothetical protein